MSIEGHDLNGLYKSAGKYKVARSLDTGVNPRKRIQDGGEKWSAGKRSRDLVGRDRKFSHVVGGSTYVERGAGRSGLRDGQSRTMGVTKLDGLARRGRGLIRLARLDLVGVNAVEPCQPQLVFDRSTVSMLLRFIALPAALFYRKWSLLSRRHFVFFSASKFVGSK